MFKPDISFIRKLILSGLVATISVFTVPVASQAGELLSSPATEQESSALLLQLQQKIKPGVPSTEIIQILGLADQVIGSYNLFYSSALSVYFDEKGVVSRFQSDVSPDKSTKKSSQEIAASSRNFKNNVTDRRNEAEKLLPLLEVGLPIQEVESLLGLPDTYMWIYKLDELSQFSIQIDPKLNTVMSYSLQ